MPKAETILKSMAFAAGAVLVGAAVVPEGTKTVIDKVTHTVVDGTHNVVEWVVDNPFDGEGKAREGGMEPKLPRYGRIFNRQAPAIKA